MKRPMQWFDTRGIAPSIDSIRNNHSPTLPGRDVKEIPSVPHSTGINIVVVVVTYRQFQHAQDDLTGLANGT